MSSKQKWVSLSKWAGRRIDNKTQARIAHQEWTARTGISPSSIQKQGNTWYIVYREQGGTTNIGATIEAFTLSGSGRKTPKTVQIEQTRLRVLATWLAERCIYALGQVKRVHIEEWLDELPHRATTKKHYLGVVKSWLNWCVDMGHIDGNPAAKIKPPANYDPRPTQALTDDQHRIIERKIPQPERDFCTILLYTGLRLAELCRLKWDDVNFERGEITIRPDGSNGAPKGTRYRKDFDVIPIHPKVRKILEKRLDHAKTYVFHKDNRDEKLFKSHNHWYIRCTAIFHAHGMSGVNLHSLRHTFVTRLAESGLSAFSIQRLARHKDISTTQRYVHRATDLSADIRKLR